MSTTIISCFSGTANVEILPVGFKWVNDLLLVKSYPSYYELEIMLHGSCLKYGLKNHVYNKSFGTDNPYKSLLKKWNKLGIKIKICNLCLTEEGYSATTDILKFIVPVTFSIQYLIDQQFKTSGKTIVIYDSPVPTIKDLICVSTQKCGTC